MSKSYAKATSLLRDVADKLKIRYAGSSTIDTVREAQDSTGWPMIFLSDGGAEGAGSAVIALRMSAVDAISKDVFGNDLTAYAPHNLEIAYEKDAGGKPTPAEADLLIAEFEAIKTGVKIQLKEIANGTAVTATSMDAKSADVEIDELYWPTKSV